MKKALLFFFITTFIGVCEIHAQIVSTAPSIFTADQSVTITYDATQGNAGLVSVASVHMHAGVILTGSSGTVWSNVVGQWGNPASVGQMTSIGGNKWQITIPSIRTYFGVSVGVPIYRIGMVFRESGPCGGFGGASTNCKEGKTSANGDIFVDLSQGGFDVAFSAPVNFPIFKSVGETLTITGNASQSSLISIRVNGVEKAVVSNATAIDYNHVVEESGLVTVLLTADNGVEIKERSFTYLVRSAGISQTRPIGLVNGINYHPSDPSKATLVFLAPQKNSVYVVGDFNDWEIQPAYQMKKDGEFFWLEVNGLTNGAEYAFQYLIDENFYVADPYCDKILDPSNDQFISSAVYPALKAYPANKATGIVSVLQTGQSAYTWQTSNYVRPNKEKLIVYELLVRDFETDKSYQGVINRLDYLDELGINAIELMPVMEFAGNNSWGYNPIFYFAPDKAYGTKNKLKELIDKAHARGIAVILDMVLNQADFEFPYVKMYWDNGKPATTSPWFNRDATHPFSVFFDFNHDSPYTETLVDDINKYWLTEYKFDGFRFDLSKGFTQTVNTDVNLWGHYDQSRVDNLTRMANEIWEVDPAAYVILEHLGVDAEESVLTNNGMMVWGIMHESYKQNSIGFSSNSDISRTFYKNRSGSWNNKASIVAYMESHDEERIMYENLQFGNASGSYNIKTLSTSLERMKAASAFLYTIPGPKMIWQFGELGYDVSINVNGRTGEKPILWNYFDNADRKKLYETTSAILSLRNEYDIFHTEDVSIQGGTGLTKQLILKNQPYVSSPASPADMNVVVVGNFDVTAKNISVSFPHVGSWYHYFALNKSLDVPSIPFNVVLQPGEFRIYTDVILPNPIAELQPYVPPVAPTLAPIVFENKKAELNWVDNSVLETEYRVYRRIAGDLSFTLLDTRSRNTITYTDEGDFESFTVYEYFIEAHNLFGSSKSEIQSVTTEEIITGIENPLSGIKLFPNPSDGVFSIDTGVTIFSVEMLDFSGRYMNQLYALNGVYTISNYAAGSYVIKILTSAGCKYIRLVKR